MALCTVTGIVYLPTGEPARSRVFVFSRASRNISSEYLGVVVPTEALARTNSAGQINVDLLSGYYTVTSGDYSASANIPDQEEADFADIIAMSALPPSAPVWYSEALLARDEAVSAAESIQNLTAATGEPGSDASYNPENGVLTVPRGLPVPVVVQAGVPTSPVPGTFYVVTG